MDAWAELDRILEKSPYLRFSLSCHRNYDDVKIKTWHAVIYKESGVVVSRAYGTTRDQAVGTAVAGAAGSG